MIYKGWKFKQVGSTERPQWKATNRGLAMCLHNRELLKLTIDLMTEADCKEHEDAK